MNAMRKMIVLILLLVLITAAIPAFGSEPLQSVKESEAGITFDLTDLADGPMFLDTEADGIAMQLIVLKTEDEVRLAVEAADYKVLE